MEETKPKRPLLTRIFCSGCSFTLLGTFGYIFLLGFDLLAGILLMVSFGGLATTSVVLSEGIMGFIRTLFELFLEGISAVFGAIAGLFSF